MLSSADTANLESTIQAAVTDYLINVSKLLGMKIHSLRWVDVHEFKRHSTIEELYSGEEITISPFGEFMFIEQTKKGGNRIMMDFWVHDMEVVYNKESGSFLVLEFGVFFPSKKH